MGPFLMYVLTTFTCILENAKDVRQFDGPTDMIFSYRTKHCLCFQNTVSTNITLDILKENTWLCSLSHDVTIPIKDLSKQSYTVKGNEPLFCYQLYYMWFIPSLKQKHHSPPPSSYKSSVFDMSFI